MQSPTSLLENQLKSLELETLHDGKDMHEDGKGNCEELEAPSQELDVLLAQVMELEAEIEAGLAPGKANRLSQEEDGIDLSENDVQAASAGIRPTRSNTASTSSSKSSSKSSNPRKNSATTHFAHVGSIAAVGGVDEDASLPDSGYGTANTSMNQDHDPSAFNTVKSDASWPASSSAAPASNPSFAAVAHHSYGQDHSSNSNHVRTGSSSTPAAPETITTTYSESSSTSTVPSYQARAPQPLPQRPASDPSVNAQQSMVRPQQPQQQPTRYYGPYMSPPYYAPNGAYAAPQTASYAYMYAPQRPPPQPMQPQGSYPAYYAAAPAYGYSYTPQVAYAPVPATIASQPQPQAMMTEAMGRPAMVVPVTRSMSGSSVPSSLQAGVPVKPISTNNVADPTRRQSNNSDRTLATSSVTELPTTPTSTTSMPTGVSMNDLDNRNTPSHDPMDAAGLKKLSSTALPPLAALELYRTNAKKSNDPQVQLDFAKYLIAMAENVHDSEPDPKKAKKLQESLLSEGLKWIKKLSGGMGKSAYAEAQVFLAECYGNGSLGLAVDHDKAFSLYQQASKQSHAQATYRTAVCYEVGAGTKRDAARAVQYFRKAAALGDTASMYKLGMVLLNGLLGAPQNVREGISWLKRSAQQSNEECPHALHELGLLYEGRIDAGGSVIPDPAYAFDLFLKAAQLGYAPSQYKLGLCYEYGLLNLPIDPRRSIAWYTRAAEQGDPEAELSLSGWYLTGAEGILKQSDTEAYLWARKAADKGLPKAEYAVGYYSENGVGVKMDLEEARRWYLRAAGQGNKRALQRLKELKAYAVANKTQVRRDFRQEKDGDCIIM